MRELKYNPERLLTIQKVYGKMLADEIKELSKELGYSSEYGELEMEMNVFPYYNRPGFWVVNYEFLEGRQSSVFDITVMNSFIHINYSVGLPFEVMDVITRFGRDHKFVRQRHTHSIDLIKLVNDAVEELFKDNPEDIITELL